MKFKIGLLIYLGACILHSGKVYAQINLVPNPSFEGYDSCPSFNETPYIGISHSNPWFQPYSPGNSTDYFNYCSPDTSLGSGVPSNYEGFQTARTGFAYAGFISRPNFPFTEYREYLEVKLNDSLLKGIKYCVSFYASLANNSQISTDGIGAYFSKSAIFYSSPSWGVLSFVPQIESPNGIIILDTLNWVIVSNNFIATGGEQYITIGNFNYNSNTTTNQNNGGIYPYAYYYIDDVSVIYCDVDAGINEEAIKDFTISPNPAKDILTLNNLPNTNMELFLFDVQGRVCKHLQSVARSSLKNIDLEGLLDGMYFIKIVTASGTVTKKFVKE